MRDLSFLLHNAGRDNPREISTARHYSHNWALVQMGGIRKFITFANEDVDNECSRDRSEATFSI